MQTSDDAAKGDFAKHDAKHGQPTITTPLKSGAVSTTPAPHLVTAANATDTSVGMPEKAISKTSAPAKQAIEKIPALDLLFIPRWYFDVIIVSFLGSLICFFSVLLSGMAITLMAGQPLDMLTLTDTSALCALAGFVIYLVCSSVPVLPGILLLLRQCAVNAPVGRYICDVLSAGVGFHLSPSHAETGLSLALTFVFSVLPIFALPIYMAALVSSPWKRTIAWSDTEIVVTNLRGKPLSFIQALKRCFFLWIAVWCPILTCFGKAGVDRNEWLTQTSQSMMVRQPRHTNEIAREESAVKVRYLAMQTFENLFVPSTAQKPTGLARKKDVSFTGALFTLVTLMFVTLSTFIWGFGVIEEEIASRLLFGVGNVTSSMVPHFLLGIFSFMKECGPLSLVYLASAFFVWSLTIICRTTHVELRRDGFRFISQNLLGFMQSIYPWSNVSQIVMVSPPKKPSLTDRQIVFELKNGKNLRLRVGSISVAGREEILKAIERWAPGVPRTPDVIQALQPLGDYTYTQIWMEALSAAPKRERLTPLATGATLNGQQYTIKQTLGAGGQGTAYLAEDILSGQEVVLKEFLLPVYVDVGVRKKALETFEKEARLLRKMSHPQIIKPLDYFVEDHRAYLVIEHVDGESLRELGGKERINNTTVISLALQMCDMLEYLHGQSPPIVHRDFTPENLLLRKDGTLKLIDFNVAYQSEQGVVSSVVGKPAYIPPEQFRGTPVPQSDIYAMGGCLHFLLTGQEPEILSSSDPRAACHSVMPALAEIVMKATEPEIADRFADAKEIKAALLSIDKDSKTGRVG